MNADVEKAVEVAEVRNEMRGDSGRYPNGEGWGHCYRVDGHWLPKDAWQTIRQALRDQEAEIARLKDAVMRKEGELSHAMIHSASGDVLLREALRYLDPRQFSEVIARITAHLGDEHE